MKKFFIGFLLGVIITAGMSWYYTTGRDNPQIQQKTENIKQGLAKSGRIVREETRELGAAIADSTSDGRITAKIKAKLLADRDLSGLSISVDTTDGRVTLAGTVTSHENIGKALRLALETEGVVEVASTLQVKLTNE